MNNSQKSLTNFRKPNSQNNYPRPTQSNQPRANNHYQMPQQQFRKATDQTQKKESTKFLDEDNWNTWIKSLRLGVQKIGAEAVMDHETYSDYVLAQYQKHQDSVQTIAEQFSDKSLMRYNVFQPSERPLEDTTIDLIQQISPNSMDQPMTYNRHNINIIIPINLMLIEDEEDLDEWSGCFYDNDDMQYFIEAYKRGYPNFTPEMRYNVPKNYRKKLKLSTCTPMSPQFRARSNLMPAPLSTHRIKNQTLLNLKQ